MPAGPSRANRRAQYAVLMPATAQSPTVRTPNWRYIFLPRQNFPFVHHDLPPVHATGDATSTCQTIHLRDQTQYSNRTPTHRILPSRLVLYIRSPALFYPAVGFPNSTWHHRRDAEAPASNCHVLRTCRHTAKGAQLHQREDRSCGNGGQRVSGVAMAGSGRQEGGGGNGTRRRHIL